MGAEGGQIASEVCKTFGVSSSSSSSSNQSDIHKSGKGKNIDYLTESERLYKKSPNPSNWW